MNSWILRFLVVAAGLMLSGCLMERLEGEQQASELREATNTYRSAVRWGYFDTAYGFHRAEEGEPEPLQEDIANIRVTSYEVAVPAVIREEGDGEKLATQTVIITYVHEDDQRQRVLRDNQLWKYDAAHRAWYMISPMPFFE
jgi:hypothetical protein